ncbi:hypothetical protein [Pseudonocardia sp. H11422]|uniref:hypothetical protein n=1 Tax=Pseudonocardia sp. H11422 TaxID=2835866 RepID=UPI001BDC1556|nr:hypothetical protein [Pseudonocardia sp. H11422]
MGYAVADHLRTSLIIEALAAALVAVMIVVAVATSNWHSIQPATSSGCPGRRPR